MGVFSLLRLIGAGCMLGTVKKDSHSLWAGVLVCESLGVLLLIFTLLEMMERMYIGRSILTVVVSRREYIWMES